MPLAPQKTPQRRVPKSLVWLASYPKSGNTWLRAFLGNYFFDHGGAMPLAALKRISSGDSSGAHYTEITGKAPTALDDASQAQARRVVLSRIAFQAPMSLVKTHCANVRLAGVRLIPPEVTRLAVYVIRNPLDLALSYADHFGLSPEGAAAAIGDAKNRVPANAKTTAQLLGSWSAHVESWVGERAFPVIVLRYEDMLADPAAAFAPVVEAMGAPVDAAVMAAAVRHASFESLAAQEAASGFEERGASQERFFRAGRAGVWQDALPEAAAARIRADHGEVMARYGY